MREWCTRPTRRPRRKCAWLRWRLPIPTTRSLSGRDVAASEKYGCGAAFLAFLSSGRCARSIRRSTVSCPPKIKPERTDPSYNSPRDGLVSSVDLAGDKRHRDRFARSSLGLAAAVWRENRRRARATALIDGIFLLPLVLPPTVVGFFLLLLFGRNGPLGELLRQFGAMVVFSWPATVIAATVVAFPLMYLTARAALEQVDPHLLQAARTLGASEWREFFGKLRCRWRGQAFWPGRFCRLRARWENSARR